MKDTLNRQLIISITSGTVVKAIVICLLAWLLWTIRDLILVILTAIVIASAINPAARFLVSKRIPRIIAILLIYTGIIAVLIAFFAVFLPPLVDDIQQLLSQLPKYIETLSNDRLSELPGISTILQQAGDSGNTMDIINRVTTGFTGATYGFLSAASAVFGGLLSFILIVVISFYLSVQEDGVRDFLKIISPVKKERYVLDLWKRSQRKIGLWMQGQLLLAALIGILTYLGLSIIGIPNPMFLALIAAVFELIPIFGPILAAIPAVFFALIDGGFTLGLVTVGLYAIIQQFESQLIHPLVVKKIVGIPALVAIVALIIGAQVAGFLGIILSVPIAAAIMELVSDIDKQKSKQLEDMEKAAQGK
jgi:predicted PurR-regulated permease PerM